MLDYHRRVLPALAVPAALFLATPVHAQSPGCSSPSGEFDVGGFARVGWDSTATRLADVDNDGLLDVVSVRSTTDLVTVSLGLGDREFGSPRSSPHSDRPWSMDAADLDGDGHVDVVSGDLDDTLSISFGNSSGYFHGTVSIALPETPWRVRAAQLNGDSFADLLVLLPSPGTVGVLLGQAGGGFGPLTEFPAATGSREFEYIDVNSDGERDVVVLGYDSDRMSVLISRGDGTFDPPKHRPFSDHPVGMVFDDLDGDGDIDAMVAVRNRTDLYLLRGDDTGTFAVHGLLPLDFEPSYLKLGDLDSDGTLDLLLRRRPGIDYQYFRRQGSFAFVDTHQVGIASADEVFLHDVDEDGLIDAYFRSFGARVTFAWGQGFGEFEAHRPTQYEHSTSRCLVNDFDNDGFADVLFWSYDNYSINLLRGKGNGRLHPVSVVQPLPTPSTPETTDYDDDGHLDLVLLGASQLTTLRGLGGATFDTPVSTALATNMARFLTLADFNGDGVEDALFHDIATDQLAVMLSRGDGTFEPEIMTPAGTQIESFDVAELNGDHALDILVSCQGSRDLRVLLGAGDGHFTTGHVFTFSHNQADVLLGDLNGDSLQDAVLFGLLGSGGGLKVMHGLPNGDFTGPVDVKKEWGVSDGRLADVNADGALDLVLVSLPDHFSVFLGHGDGTFAPERPYPAGFDMDSLELVDMNTDGILDVVGADRSINKIGVVLGSQARPGAIGTPVCDLDDWTAGCPCGNMPSAPERGCTNSSSAGARICATGSPSVVADTVDFHLTDATPSQVAMLLQGTVSVELPFRDGTLCVGGSTDRLRLATTGTDGVATLGAPFVQDAQVTAGQTRIYQWWYRDPGGTSPCGSGSNLSNALEIRWR